MSMAHSKAFMSILEVTLPSAKALHLVNDEFYRVPHAWHTAKFQINIIVCLVPDA